MARLLPFWLKTSRPGLWFQTLWLYTLPTAQMPVWTSALFWLGLVYVTFPLNFLVYGWNDLVDAQNDLANPRKDSFLFGARGTSEERATLPMLMTAAQVPFAVALIWFGGFRMAACLIGMIVCLWLYNLPVRGWRGRPPLELGNQLGYLLILPMSIILNQAPAVSWAAWFYLVLFCTHSHLMGEVMDVVPDAKAGRSTSARVLGVRLTKLIITALVFSEGSILGLRFHDWYLGGALFVGCIWLLLDMLVLFPEGIYTRRQFQLFGLGINVAGFASMAWVWETRSLLR